ncbi:alpha/beta fold hydrolase [Falsibacillus albus]|uniref:Alpha/beta hydrolase n=1 Tax=Falsibacillus albus TaxID=2478915 RepID=A0A3L7JXB0_9BACI|nr:alpha/beta hydrolase [Falsibacillus albus]RLQ95427.1 alpha/beta hydrolase [Falsibacillus albus]
MAEFKLNDDTILFYTDSGTGTPIIFIHGVWMSSKFFQKQIPFFEKQFRTITIDLRGHGKSSKVPSGHTVSSYAADLHSFINKLKLKEVILVGWSMGAFVVWEYLKSFGNQSVKGTVIVDELASDFKWSDFDIGAFDLPTLIHFMRQIQTNREQFVSEFIPLMFKEPLSSEDAKWMNEEVNKVPESIASAILFDQSIVDYRDFLPSIATPTLLCFGRDEKLIPVAAGEHLYHSIPGSVLQIFENSCHCPFLEEPDEFNRSVANFIKSL